MSCNGVWRERKPTRCNNQMFIINFCLNMFRALLCPSSGKQKLCVTACDILRWFCWMWLVVVVWRCVVGCEHCEGYCSTQAVMGCYWNVLSRYRLCQCGLELGFGQILFFYWKWKWLFGPYARRSPCYQLRTPLSVSQKYMWSSVWQIQVFWE